MRAEPERPAPPEISEDDHDAPLVEAVVDLLVTVWRARHPAPPAPTSPADTRETPGTTEPGNPAQGPGLATVDEEPPTPSLANPSYEEGSRDGAARPV